MVARLLWEQDAAGSNPVTSTTRKPHQIAIFRLFRAIFILQSQHKLCEIKIATLKFCFLGVS